MRYRILKNGNNKFKVEKAAPRQDYVGRPIGGEAWAGVKSYLAEGRFHSSPNITKLDTEEDAYRLVIALQQRDAVLARENVWEEFKVFETPLEQT